MAAVKRLVHSMAAARQAPAASISVHKGMRIQASLCVERPPLRVMEPAYRKRWRAFRDDWERRTGNTLSVDDEIVFMKYHFHFLEDQAAQRALSAGADAGAPQIEGTSAGVGGGAGKGKRAVKDAKPREDAVSLFTSARGIEEPTGLDAVLTEEGLDLTFPERGARTVRKRKVEKRVAAKVDDSDVRSLRRLGQQSLFLLVKYAGGRQWTFPKDDRPQGQAMRETLLKLCQRQLGERFEPYIVGACPFTYWKRKSSLLPGIDGRKIFYYRARLLPGGMDVTLPSDSPVEDWAWCTQHELPEYLGEGEWQIIRDTLPLDAVE
eukprot:gnl/TRDRNA2_/TRDRNA2_42560_c0_seq1.p1 gnl/TRDRNA2_/TRDRNA2_42560_c0~~gnl/TRDRNA2_/TRDRNA2_42560_c0_seq1.p1  ORF type:complete len:340 (+),score=48.52 gnl/TRDRNA2_/TRDRNA2_42560_c0_seq1:60-1022(+)